MYEAYAAIIVAIIFYFIGKMTGLEKVRKGCKRALIITIPITIFAGINLGWDWESVRDVSSQNNRAVSEKNDTKIDDEGIETHTDTPYKEITPTSAIAEETETATIEALVDFEENVYPYSDGEWYYLDENTAISDDRYVYSSMDDFYNDYSGSWQTDAEGDPGSYYFPLYFGTAGPSTVYEAQFQLHYDYGQHWNPNTNVVYEMEDSMYCQYCDAYYMTE